MQFRPPGAPPVLATDQAYNAPGKDWDALDTKIKPSDAELAAGYTPEEPIEAEIANYLGNDAGKRLVAVDLIDVTNWPEPAAATGTMGSTGNAAGGMCEAPGTVGLSISPGRLFSFATNAEEVSVSDDGGYSWATEYTSAGHDFKGIAAGAGSIAAILDSAGTPKIAKITGTQGWTEQSIATFGAGSVAAIAWDPVASVYLLGGEASGLTDGGIYTCPETDLPTTMTDISPATSSGDPIDLIAVGTDRVLFSDGPKIYAWDRTGVASETHTFPGAFTCRALLADTSSGYFYAACYDGSSGRVYESADGVTWTLKSAGTLFDDFQPICGIARGSALVIGGNLDGIERFAVSGDRGVSWDFIADPCKRHGNQTGALAYVGNRIAALAYKSAGDRVHAFAMRAGPLR